QRPKFQKIGRVSIEFLRAQPNYDTLRQCHSFLTPFLRPFSSSPTNSNQLKLAHDRTEIRNPPDSPLAKRELLRLENQPLNQR
ncbi:MAG: hypothetical protein ACK52A_07995, partial [Planctomycetota bacterium]